MVNFLCPFICQSELLRPSGSLAQQILEGCHVHTNFCRWPPLFPPFYFSHPSVCLSASISLLRPCRSTFLYIQLGSGFESGEINQLAATAVTFSIAPAVFDRSVVFRLGCSFPGFWLQPVNYRDSSLDAGFDSKSCPLQLDHTQLLIRRLCHRKTAFNPSNRQNRQADSRHCNKPFSLFRTGIWQQVKM